MRVLRCRIHTTTSINDFDAAVIKLGAKRCSYDASPDPGLLTGAIDLSDLTVGDPTADRTQMLGGLGVTLSEGDAIRACQMLTETVPLEPERFASPRPVAALAVDRAGRLLGAAVNNNVVNRLCHAEFNLVFAHFVSDLIPAGSTIYTSLSPCRMCAALLARVAADGHGLRVVAMAMDTGRYGRQSSIATTLWTE